jgi:putative oxidoreductase
MSPPAPITPAGADAAPVPPAIPDYRRRSFLSGSLAPLILRVMVGLVFLYHGQAKLFPTFYVHTGPSPEAGTTEQDLKAAYGSDPVYLPQWVRDATKPVGLNDRMFRLGGGGIEGTKGFMEKLDLPLIPPYGAAVLAAVSETVFGLFLILGLFTRLSTIPLIITMIVAIWKVHNSAFSLQFSGNEYCLVLIAALLSLMLTGAGAVSVDAILWYLWPKNKVKRAEPAPAAGGVDATQEFRPVTAPPPVRRAGPTGGVR